MNELMDKLVKMAGKIDRNKYLKGIKDSLMTLLPLIIIGSFASLFSTLFKSEWASGMGLDKLGSMFSAISFACVSCMTIALVFLIGYLMAKANKLDPLTGALCSFASYIVLVPSFATVVVDDVETTVNNVLAGNYLGAAGMLIGLVMGIISVEILSRLMKVEKIKIKMPEEVPPAISRSFNVLIPLAITLVIVAFIGWGTVQISGSYLPDLFYKFIQKPLEGLAQTPFAAVLIIFITQVLWFLGIHGGMATRAIRSPFLMAGLAANIAAVESGLTPTAFFTETFWQTFVVFGGTGYTLSLILAVLVFSKRKDYREVAKMCLIPGIFGINEPVTYGMPIVLNPILGIPFIIAPCVCALLGYLFTSIGFAPCATVELPAGLPVFVNAIVGYPGSVTALLAVAVCFVVAFLIYAPFVIAANRIKQEGAENE